METVITQGILDYLEQSKVTLEINNLPAQVGDIIKVDGFLKLTTFEGFVFTETFAVGYEVMLIVPVSFGIDDRVYYFDVDETGTAATLTVTDANEGMSFDITTEPAEPLEIQGVNHVYLLDDERVKQIITGLYTGDSPRDGFERFIIGLIDLPFDLKPEWIIQKSNVMLGSYDTKVLGDVVYSDVLRFNLGDIVTPKLKDNFISFFNVETILHLPFVGTIALDSDYVIGETISIEYLVNVYDGITTVNISSSKLNEVVYSQSIDLVVTIPFGAVDQVPGNNNPLQTGVGVDNGVRTPYIEVLQNDAILENGFFTSPVIDEDLLLNHSGYIEVENINLKSKAKSSEKEKLIQLLKSGVIINTPNETGSISIMGEMVEGETLTAIVVDGNGFNDVAYQWLADGVIVGSSSSYVLTVNDVGKVINVKADYVDNDRYSESVLSDNLEVVKAVNIEGSISIVGEMVEGETLTAIVVDGNGFRQRDVSFAWFVDGNLNDIGDMFTLDSSSINKVVNVRAEYRDNDGYFESLMSDNNVPVKPLIPDNIPANVTIDGVFEVDETLTAIVVDGNGFNDVAYQWLADGVIVGSNSTYVITNDDADKVINVNVSFVDNDGYSENVTSSNTVKIPIPVWDYGVLYYPLTADYVTPLGSGSVANYENGFRFTVPATANNVGVFTPYIHTFTKYDRYSRYVVTFDVYSDWAHTLIVHLLDGEKLAMDLGTIDVKLGVPASIRLPFYLINGISHGGFRIYANRLLKNKFFQITNFNVVKN